MKNILFLQSSVLGAHSQTRPLVQAVAAALAQAHPQATQRIRDLGHTPLPHLRGEHLAQAPAEAQEALAELKQADALVIGAPMYNFGVPSTLKAWLDHVLKAGETFCYTEAGPQGMLQGKKVLLVISTGGVYSEGAYKSYDFVEPYLRAALGFIGITDVTAVRVEGGAVNAEQGAASAQAAKQAALDWAARS